MARRSPSGRPHNSGLLDPHGFNDDQTLRVKLHRCYLAGKPQLARTMTHKIYSMPFAKVYVALVNKVERKGRTKEEVDHVICWLTGYDETGLRRQLENQNDVQTFFAEAPAMHPNRSMIKGVVCGVRVEDVEDPLMQKIRQLDKLVDELAKGKSMEKILRQ
jgi:hypothetical protein